ncbi:hemolysin family protein [Parasphingorhabdus pacifica]
MDGVALNLVLVLVFVLIGGFFAAAEIALVSLREGQVRGLAERGRRGARVARLKSDSNRFLSAVQVGVTFAGFFASSYGGATIAVRLEPALAGLGLPIGLAATVALILVTLFVSYLSLVFGELAPKRLALQMPEGVSLFTAGVLDRVATFFRPVIWLLSKSTNAVVRVIGLNPGADEPSVSEEELRDMVRTNQQLTVEERRLVIDAFEAGDRVLSEVMVPRTEVSFLESGMSLAEAATEVEDKPHSRYPVTHGSADEVVGFVHIRDLYAATHDLKSGVDTVGDLARPVTAMPGSKPILSALARMRRGGGHMALVIDEYGGTDGIVTVEDLVEEVVGEIWDEYDPSARPVEPATDGAYYADGLLHRNDVEEQTGIVLPDGPHTTLAGFVLSRLGRTPAEGDSVRALGHVFTVSEMDGRRIARLRITPVENGVSPRAE